MKKSITKNYLYNMSYQILKIIIPILTTPYLSRVLGAESIGIYSYTLSIVTYFILFGALGTLLYGQREIAYVQDDLKKKSIKFWEIFILRVVTLTVSSIIFYITFCVNNQYELYYKILILELIANIIDISWYFHGLEEFKKTVIRNTIVKLISVILIFFVVKSSNDLYKYFIIYVLSNLIGNISLWMYLPKYIRKINFRELNIIQHIKPTVCLFIPQIAIQIYTVLDKTMIGAIIPDKAETGFYEQSEKIVKLLLTIVTSLGTVMLPRIANTFAHGNKEKVKSYIKNTLNFVFCLSLPLMFGIIVISKEFVPVFFGIGYDKVAILLKVISPIILMIGISNVIGNQFLITTKRQKEYTISVTVGAVTNLILNLFLIRSLASIGAAIATVIAEITVTAIQLYFIRKEISIKEIIQCGKNYFFASIIMFFICLFIKNIVIADMLSIAIQVCVGVSIYFSILILRKDQFIYKIIEILKQKIFRRNYDNV